MNWGGDGRAKNSTLLKPEGEGDFLLGVAILIRRIGGVVNANALYDRFKSGVSPNATFSGFVVLLLRPFGDTSFLPLFALHAEIEVRG